MITKKKKIKIIDIIFCLIIIIGAIIECIRAIKTGDFNIEIVDTVGTWGIKEFIIMLFAYSFIFLFSIIVSLLKHFYITVLYIGGRTAYKKYSKDKLEKVDLKNENYYRDIINEYSPAVLSYIDDFQLEEKDIVATIMSLKLKNKLSIENKIEVINDNENDLDENEKYVLKNLKNNTYKNINMLEFEKIVIRDCLNYKLLEEKKDIKKEILKKVIFSICIYILIFVSFFNFPYLYSKFDENIAIIFLLIMCILFLSIIIFPFAAIIHIRTYYLMNANNPYIRNKVAKNINTKLEGLRNYIKDFSQINERQYKEIELWEDYLIYSVILGKNSKIVEEVMDKINT